MSVPINTIEYYAAPNGKIPFKEWFNSLRDRKAQEIIDARITNVERGVFGDCEPVGGGVSELKIHYGPGYRIYFGQVGKVVVLLLFGGTKKTQNANINKARQYWDDYRSEE